MKKTSAANHPPIAPTPLAIVGIGCLFPQADHAGTFWTNIKTGADAISEVPASHWRSDDYFNPDPKAPDQVYAKHGGFLSPVDFNPMEYGVLPNALEAIDTSQLLGLVAVDQALKDAGYGADRQFDRDKVSVVLGVTGTLELVIPLGARLGFPRWREALKDAGIEDAIAEDAMRRIADSYVPWQENSFPGLLGNVVAGRISKHFDFGGTNCVVDAACGSSLSALSLAAMELATGKADMVVTGGIDTFNDIFMYTCFSKTPALSPSGHARPFADDADGTTLGEGLGILVLKRLADAERDNDRIYAVIKGVGSSSDGRGSAIYEPNAAGQQKALLRAYQQGAIEPDSIELIEAHGTGTRVGDAVEVSALRAVFGDADTPWCAIGSIKSQIGHTKAAAGSAGLIKAALALYHKTLPPTIKVARPQEAVSAARTPFYVNTETRPWLPRGAHPRRAGVSALGFGGSNFHCLLEEHRAEKTVTDWQGDVQIAAFAAADREGLASALQTLPDGGDWNSLRLAAGLSRQQFDPSLPQRLCLVIEKDKTDRQAQLKSALGMLSRESGRTSWNTPDGAYYACGEATGSLAMLFPGQGAQYPGMLRDLAVQFPQFLEVLRVAEDSFVQATDGKQGRLIDKIYPLPAFSQAEKDRNQTLLQATENAQPALGAVSLGAKAVLNGFGISAEAYAGHSYGELTALCAGRVFDPQALHSLSRLRGELMAAGRGDGGAMLAVSAPLERIEQFLAETGLKLVLANRNTPQQGVLSGAGEEIQKAAALLESQGLRCTRLPVAAAFHSELVSAASKPFAEKLATLPFAKATASVYANTSGGIYPAAEASAKRQLAEQLAKPVDFVTEIENMYQAGIRTFLEVGPGARLTGMVKAILGERDYQALSIDASNGQRSGIHDLARAIGQLAVLGQSVALELWDAGYVASRAQAPKKPGMTVALTGANYFKPPAKRPPVAVQPAAVTPQPAALAAPAQVPAPAPAAAGDPSALQEALRITQQSMQALQQIQEQTARLHQQFLEGQELATRSFLGLVEQQRTLAYGGSSTSEPRPSAAPTVHPVAPAAPAPLKPAAAPMAPMAAPAGPVAAADATTTSQVASVLLEVIAEKTGYPVEMLELEMALDTDLGIDSIKRVEILSALQQRLPDAPAVKPEDLGVLQTLGQIVAHLDAGMPAIASQPAAAGPQVEAIATGRAADLSAALLEVIAEKTGYPVAMLELEMALDTDLGIDSIKRVEILSALQQRLPDAPAVKPEDLGVLQTIGQIVEHLAGGRHKPGALPPAAATPVTRIARDTVATTLLDVVAAKTGYPVAMLELEMALDTDLGIDSIKRVEILSALQEQLPGVPAIKPEHLGTLQTLGQIVDFLASVSGTPESAAAPEAAASSQTAASIERQVLKVVPLQAKTVRDRLQPAAGAEIWVTADGGALPAQLCRELEARQLVPRQAAIEELLASEPSPQLSGLIIVAPRQGTGDRFLQQAFQLLQRVEPALTAAAETGASPFLATLSRLNGCFGLTPGAPLHDPLSGGLAGLCKTAGHEWPGIHCKALDLANDLADTEQTAHRVVDEILTRGPVEIGLTAQGLYSLKLTSQSVPAERRQMPLAAGELVVISGGARGVTAEVAVALAKAGQATLLLLGRSPEATAEPDWLTGLTAENEIKKALIAHAQSPLKPKDVARRYRELSSNREILKNIGRIEAAGGTAVYRSVDLRDAAAVAAVIAEARQQFGPVKGLIHGAGVLADRLIKDKTLEQFDAVYQTKIAGLRALLAAVEADPLNFMALFSSSTGRFGRTGQIDYAVANEILNKLAQQQATARPACRVVSLNWGPWDGGMVTAALKQVFEQEGIRVIDLKAGAQYLIQEISTPPGGPVELVILGADQQEASEEPVQQQNIYVSRAFDLDLSIEQYPFLKSHVLDGRAVLPLAVIVEWLAHAAIHNNPGLRFHGFNDLRVLKGVILEAGQVHNLQLMTGKAIKSDGVHVVPVELSGTAADGRQHVHARAKIVLAGRLPAAKAAAERLELPDYARPIEEIYRPERLFHGPDFHGIREVLGCSDAGISCLVRPAPAPQQWITQPLRNAWLADPLALDCSFQLLILWSFERYNAGSLPVFAGRYRQYQERFPEHGAEIRVRLLEQSSSKATAEIDFIDPVSGSLIARIEDYQCVIDASLNASFQRNKLQGVA